MRVGIVSIQHESNTFVPQPTTLEDFRADTLLEGEDVRRRFAEGEKLDVDLTATAYERIRENTKRKGTPVKGTKNIKLVQEYANFTLSPEYGEFMARNTRYAPCSKAAVERLEPQLVKDLGIDTTKVDRVVFKEIPPNKPRWEEIWNEIKAA